MLPIQDAKAGLGAVDALFYLPVIISYVRVSRGVAGSVCCVPSLATHISPSFHFLIDKPRECCVICHQKALPQM